MLNQPFKSLRRRAVLFRLITCLIVLGGAGGPAFGAQTTTEKIGTATDKAMKSIADAGKSAASKVEDLWQKVDEQRLKNRTRDEIVAWVIMGLLVGGLLANVVKLNRGAALVLGLAGAFVGGIVAHLTELNLGLGPVLIRYEDLLLSLAGGLLLMLGGKLFLKRKQQQKG